MSCPFSDTVAVVTDNGTVTTSYVPNGYDTKVPQMLLDIYSSGTAENTTVSNYFDIQWRSYKTITDKDINSGSAFLVGAFRPLQNILLRSAIQPVEGLLVDTVDGGIGFRNHTLPKGVQLGATWTEDLLFIQPETSCVNTNLTLDFVTTTGSTNKIAASELIDRIVLTDRGGFVNLNRTYPFYNRSHPESNPDLMGRAYKAAWLNNALSMLYLNVTNHRNSTTGAGPFTHLNSSIGKTFPMSPVSGEGVYDALGISSKWGFYLDLDNLHSGSHSNNTLAANPFNVLSQNFSDIGIECSGAGGADSANISNIFAACGLVSGAARRDDGKSPLVFESGSGWSIPLYSCASAIKATIKTVDFNFNGKLGLDSLEVIRVQEKVYRDESSLPYWGVEDPGMNYSDAKPLWGLISHRFADHPNMSTVHQESLYLPGWSASGTGPSAIDYENMPASDFFGRAMRAAYEVGPTSGNPVSSAVIDYSGYSNMALWAKWLELSASPEKATKIINLIWTDYAAGSVVGTKGTLGPGNAGATNQAAQIAVQPIVRQIRYHYLYAIPAFIVAALWLLTTFLALLFWIFGKSNFATMRRHLYQSSTGRILATFLYPGDCDLRMESKVWSRNMGAKTIDLAGGSPAVAELVVQSHQKGNEGLQTSQASINDGSRSDEIDEHMMQEGHGFLQHP